MISTKILLSQKKKNKYVSGNRSEILGRVGTHIFLIIFFLEKYNFMPLKGKIKMHKIIFFSENLEKNLGFASKFR